MSLSDRGIKCVMFDLGGVVCLFDTKRFYDELKKRSTTSVDPRELLYGRYGEPFILFEKGEIGAEELYSFFKKTLGLNMTREAFMRLMYEIFTIDIPMVEILKDLKTAGVALIAVSNLNIIHEESLRVRFPHVVALFDCLMLSHNVGFRKPDPRMWLSPMKSLGKKIRNKAFEPYECLYVDDLIANVNAFRALGGLTYHYAVTDENFILDLNMLSHHREQFHKILERLEWFET